MIENLEKALAQALAYKERYVSIERDYGMIDWLQPRDAVVCDILISRFTILLQRKSNEILSIYGDQDGMLREETEIFGGQRFATDA